MFHPLPPALWSRTARLHLKWQQSDSIHIRNTPNPEICDIRVISYRIFLTLLVLWTQRAYHMQLKLSLPPKPQFADEKNSVDSSAIMCEGEPKKACEQTSITNSALLLIAIWRSANHVCTMTFVSKGSWLHRDDQAMDKFGGISLQKKSSERIVIVPICYALACHLSVNPHAQNLSRQI